MLFTLRNIGYHYGQKAAVVDMALEIAGGRFYGLMGPNGCGKSTLLKIAAGVEKPRAGRVSIFGDDLWTDEVKARRSLAYLPEHPDLTPFATVHEILQMVCGLRGELLAAVEAALEWTGMVDLGSRTVRELSMGQRRRAVLAAAYIGNPSCFLLDEPLEAMDRTFRSTMVAWLTEHRAAGATIVIVSHEIDSFAPIADRAVTFHRGRCTVVENLGETTDDRRSTLDRLARGL